LADSFDVIVFIRVNRNQMIL